MAIVQYVMTPSLVWMSRLHNDGAADPSRLGRAGPDQDFFFQSRMWVFVLDRSFSFVVSSASDFAYWNVTVVVSVSVFTFVKPSAGVRAPRTEAAQPPQVMFGTSKV